MPFHIGFLPVFFSNIMLYNLATSTACSSVDNALDVSVLSDHAGVIIKYIFLLRRLVDCNGTP